MDFMKAYERFPWISGAKDRPECGILVGELMQHNDQNPQVMLPGKDVMINADMITFMTQSTQRCVSIDPNSALTDLSGVMTAIHTATGNGKPLRVRGRVDHWMVRWQLAKLSTPRDMAGPASQMLAAAFEEAKVSLEDLPDGVQFKIRPR